MLSRLLRQLSPFAFALLMLLFAAVSSAQNARFSGQITDAQNAAIPKAAVEITNLDTGAQVQTVSDDAGDYSVPYLSAGRYRIVVRAQGFDLSAHEVTLGMGQALVFNVQLTVAGAQATVTVQGGSELTELHLQSNEMSGTITGKEVTGIQLNGRNFTQLMALAPGVSNQTQQDEARVGMAGSVSFSVNGGRTEYNSFQVDGSEVLNVGINKDHTSLIVTPSIDAIQEIKVLTSNYGAMYPSAGNGTTIVTTKSGTDSYHGSLYEFFRNEDLNAKGYFDIGNRAPLYRRNDFGGTIGGPLSIPHIYNAQGKTHFFFSEEARIEKDPYAYRQAVPSLTERNGDFSDLCPALANGEFTTFSRTQYPDCPASVGNFTFPSNQINYPLPIVSTPFVLNQNALAILGTGIIPLPNATTGCNSTGSACYLADVSLPTYWREELFRIDHAISSKVQANFRYIHDEWDETTPVPQYAFTQNSFPTIQNRFYAPGMSLVARLTAAFSSTFLNEFVASYTDSFITMRNLAGPGTTLARPSILDDPCNTSSWQCGLTTIFSNGAEGIDGVPKIPGIAIGGNNGAYGGYGFAADPGYMPWEHTNPTYSFSDNLNKFIGRHSLQFGVQWVIFQRNQTSGPIGAATGDVQGLFSFNNIGFKPGTGNAFANFLFTEPVAADSGGPMQNEGYISSFQQDSGQGRYRERYQIVEPYLQDDFKVTPRLTLNLGLRMSLFGTYREANNMAYNWEQSAFNTTVAQTMTVGASGNLVNASDQSPITINQSNPQQGLDPRIINGIVHCGTGNIPSTCMSGHLWNPAPRVGFAWDPTGAGKLALRGGYGIFFEHGTADEANTGSLEAGAPLVLNMTQSGTGLTGWSQIGGGLAFPINVTSIPTKAVWPYVQQWSLSIEHQLPANALATVAYVGSTGHHLAAELEINQLTPLSSAENPFAPHVPLRAQGYNPTVGGNVFQGDCTPSSPGSSSFTLMGGTVIAPGSAPYANMQAACLGNGGGGQANSLRTFAPGIGEIYSLQNVANSSYHSLQATFRKVQGPLTVGIAYTYSHSFDNASDRSDATFVNSFNLASNRASSNFDQRHLLHISYIYELPLRRILQSFLANINGDANPENDTVNQPPSHFITSKVGGTLADGWQLSGLTLFESGIPFTVVNNGSPTGVGTLDNAGVANGVGSGSYPDLSGISPHSRKPIGGNNGKSFGPLLLNPAAFLAPQGLTFGNAGRNDLNNPNRLNWDVALLKRFRVSEGLSTDFRVEAFNLTNHTQFRIYDPTLGPQAQNEVSCYGGDAAYYSAAGGDGVDCLTGSSFLHPVDAHRPRTIQLTLKLAF